MYQLNLLKSSFLNPYSGFCFLDYTFTDSSYQDIVISIQHIGAESQGKNKINNCAVHRKNSSNRTKVLCVVFNDVFPGCRTLFRIYEYSMFVG